MSIVKRINRMDKFIKMVSAGSGESYGQSFKMLKHAKDIGLTYAFYVEHKGWEYSDEELLALKKAREERMEAIALICKETEWTNQEVENKLDYALSVGISCHDFIIHEGWMLDRENVKSVIKERVACTKELCELTGCNIEEAVALLKKGRMHKLPDSYFVKNQCYLLDDAQMEATGNELELQRIKDEEGRQKEERIAKIRALHLERVEEICKATGWPPEKVEEQLKVAKEIGLTERQYVTHNAWTLSENEIIELSQRLEKIKELKEQRMATIKEATGWDDEKIKAELKCAKDRGITERQYVVNQVWSLSEEEIVELCERLRKLKEVKNQRIARLREATGWDDEKIKAELKRGKDLGLSEAEYMRYECWTLSEEAFIEVAERKKSILEKKEDLKNPVELICKRTGWAPEQAKEKLNEASKLGISNTQYAKYEMYDLSDAELKEFSEALAEGSKRQENELEFYYRIIAEKANWSVEQAKEAVKKAEGISAKQFAQRACWLHDSEGLTKVSTSMERKNLKDSMTSELWAKKLVEVTGWSRAKVELEVLKARNNCHSSYEDYFVFKLYELSPEEQREYVTSGLFTKMRLKYNDREKAIAVLDDKVVFNETFADCINRKWFFNRNLPYEDFLNIIDGLDAVLLKPLSATQGKGIMKFKCNVPEEEKPSLYERIMSQKEAIVEEYIVQHPEVMEFCPESVNTVRITTLNANGKCNYLYAVFRMGRGGAVVDNFHSGGIASAIDMKTGITTTHAVDLNGNVFVENPRSGKKTKGFQVPHWDKILETCEKGYNRVEGVNLIGWDFAVTPDGVDLIEGNPGASYVVAQIPYVQDRIGIRDAMVGTYLD